MLIGNYEEGERMTDDNWLNEEPDISQPKMSQIKLKKIHLKKLLSLSDFIDILTPTVRANPDLIHYISVLILNVDMNFDAKQIVKLLIKQNLTEVIIAVIDKTSSKHSKDKFVLAAFNSALILQNFSVVMRIKLLCNTILRDNFEKVLPQLLDSMRLNSSFMEFKLNILIDLLP